MEHMEMMKKMRAMMTEMSAMMDSVMSGEEYQEKESTEEVEAGSGFAEKLSKHKTMM